MNKKILPVILGVVCILLAIAVVVVICWSRRPAVDENEVNTNVIEESTEVIVPEIVDVTPVDYTDVLEDYNLEAEWVMTNLLPSKVQEQVPELAQSTTPYIKDCSLSGSNILTITYGFQNTDAILLCTRDMCFDESEFMLGDVQNRYGSDYSIILFTNGVPDNSEDIYSELFNRYPYCIAVTDYVVGDTQVLLEDCTTSEVIAIPME